MILEKLGGGYGNKTVYTQSADKERSHWHITRQSKQAQNEHGLRSYAHYMSEHIHLKGIKR